MKEVVHLIQDNEYAEVWCGDDYNVALQRNDGAVWEMTYVNELDRVNCRACLEALVRAGERAKQRLSES